MSTRESWSARRARWTNAVQARLAGYARPSNAFTSQPEPRTMGSITRGRELAKGNFLFSGYLVDAPQESIWAIPMPDPAFEAEVHGFAWLDDLAAVGDAAAELRVRDWTHEWIRRYGRGSGPGWAPDLTGRRLMRWINHAMTILNGASREESAAFFRVLSAQTTFLARRWPSAEVGLPRFEALCGLIYASLSLSGMDRHVPAVEKALALECETRIDREGGIPTRNPEELLEVFALLTWTLDALSEAGRAVEQAHQEAVERVAPTLRALRHTDGGLARFHGGGRGLEGRLDQALATSGVRRMRPNGLAMGFARLSHGRASLVIDAARPPQETHSLDGHASTLAFELTSGRRPVIVNCGAGGSFGANWRRAGRATPSHSTLEIEGYSSSRLGGSGIVAGRRTELLVDTPANVTCKTLEVGPASALALSHDGYLNTHGLMHSRRLELATDGRSVMGEDSLSAFTRTAERKFDDVRAQTPAGAIRFHVRFHLHPEAEAELDMGGAAVSIRLKSGEVWVFRHDGGARMSLAPSVYLERGRLAPRATKQIVLSGAAMDYATRIGWTLAKAQDTPSYVRDLVYEDDLAID